MRWDILDDEWGVYIVGYGPHAKIGWSRAIGERIRSIEANLPQHVKLYCIIASPVADGIERGLHNRFRNLRENGEWFRYEGKLAEFCQAHLDRLYGGMAPDGDELEWDGPRPRALKPRRLTENEMR